MTNIYHRGDVEGQKSLPLPRFSKRVSSNFSKSLSNLVLVGTIGLTGLAGCVDQYGNSSMSGPNSPDLSGPALMLLGAGAGNPLAVEAGAAITNYDASIRGKAEQTVIVNNNGQGRAYQNPGQYKDNTAARLILQDPEFGYGVMFICNAANDRNKNGHIDPDEYIGLKNTFSIDEEFSVGFIIAGRSVGASVTIKDGNGGIVNRHVNRDPANGGPGLTCPPRSLKEGLYKAEFFYDNRKVGQISFEVEN